MRTNFAVPAILAAVLFGVAAVQGVKPPSEVQAAAQEARPPYVYYSRCAEARAAGVAPIHIGEPGYREALDADGIACEPYRGY